MIFHNDSRDPIGHLEKGATTNNEGTNGGNAQEIRKQEQSGEDQEECDWIEDAPSEARAEVNHCSFIVFYSI